MNRIIFNHQGTIDKYEGDAIMIIFGAPLRQSDHARRAVLCAIEMQEECMKFRNQKCRQDRRDCTSCDGTRQIGGEECGECRGTGSLQQYPDVYMRIGISSGEVIVGPIGGGDRSDYTAIGDTVNLAARLEPLNKQAKSWIMCSKATYDQVADVVLSDLVQGIQVKGKTQTVDAYAIRGLRDAMTAQTLGISTGRRDALWGEGADDAKKAPAESLTGVEPTSSVRSESAEPLPTIERNIAPEAEKVNQPAQPTRL